MFRTQFRTGGISVKFLFRELRQETAHGRHARSTAGKRARLVESEMGHAGQAFQGIPFPHQKAMPGGVPDGGHDRRGSCQHKRTGAEYHQNGNGANQFARGHPGPPCGNQGNGNDPGGPAVRQPHDFSLPRICGLDEAHHALDGTVLPGPGRLHVKGSELVDRPAGNLIPGFLVYRKRFPRHYGLVDGSVPGKNNAVRRNRLSGQYAENIPDANLFRRNNLLPGSFHFPGGRRGQTDQPFNTLPGPGHGQLLKEFPKLHDKCNLPCGEVLPNDDGGDQRDGNKHSRLNIPGRRQAKNGFQHNWNAAQHNGYP